MNCALIFLFSTFFVIQLHSAAILGSTKRERKRAELKKQREAQNREVVVADNSFKRFIAQRQQEQADEEEEKQRKKTAAEQAEQKELTDKIARLKQEISQLELKLANLEGDSTDSQYRQLHKKKRRLQI